MERCGRSAETAAICSLLATMTADRGAKMSETFKIKDDDSGEMVEYEMCMGCGGEGGYDASRNCEEYDDWHNCEECEGRGYVEVGFYEKDEFVPKRDAFMPGD